MAKTDKADMSCARVKQYTASDVSKAERHNESKLSVSYTHLLMKQYDDEQAELETKIEEMEKELTEEKTNTVDIKHFISLIRKCKEPTEISDLMFAELIDKIVVYEAEGVGKARTQKVDIYFNYVGQVDIAYTAVSYTHLHF